MDTPIAKLIRHGGQYLIFQILITFSSLITFPILTRLLTVEEYGELALVNVTILLLLGFAKCGTATAFIKYYPEYINLEKILYSSSFYAAIIISTIIAGCYIAILLFSETVFNKHIFFIWWIIPFFVLIRSLQSLIMGWMRAEEKILSCNIYSLANKLGVLFIGISILLVMKNGLPGFLVGCLISEFLLILWVFIPYYKLEKLSFSDISKVSAVQLVNYGIPLIVFELSSIAVAYIDRYQIKYYLDSASVGVYSVGYNFAMYVQQALTGPLWLAIFPILTKLWHSETKEKTVSFLNELLKYYLCVSIFLIIFASITSEEIILILASAKYSQAISIVPYVITGTVIYGSYYIAGAALLLENKTSTLAFLTAICSLINFILNIYFIPRFGILGAAYTSCISYFLLIFCINFKSKKIIIVDWPIIDIFVYVMFGLFIVFLSLFLSINNIFVSLFIKSAMCFLIYITLLIFYDIKIRITLLNIMKKFYI